MTEANLVLIQEGFGRWLCFRNPRRIIRCNSHLELSALLSEVDQAVTGGAFAAGFFSYECSPGIDPHLATHPSGDVPVAWFGIYDSAEHLSSIPEGRGKPFYTGAWKPSITEDEYYSALARIQEYIVAGTTYQVNFTFRLSSDFNGDPYTFFSQISSSQQSRNCAYIDTGDIVVCSASPELFFHLEDQRITSIPMKGTSARGINLAEDVALSNALRNSEKEQAENVMIVDMVRNDLGRIAESGTVRVSSSFAVEKYPTVLQMTSTVEARTRACFGEIIRAVFPCASVTGAPKVQTMKIIRELETTPRGVYCGAIGYAGPAGKARFNVAIRTAVINKKKGTVEYGVGSGVVADSVDKLEYSECLDKAAILTRTFPEFELLETILWTPDNGFLLLDAHLRRMLQSAEYFGFKCDRQDLFDALKKLTGQSGDRVSKVRVLCARDGALRFESSALDENTRIWHIGYAKTPVSTKDVFLYHKTTNRRVYENARNERPGIDDVILENEKGEVTETSIANIVAVIKGKHITPAASCGLLCGVYREYLLMNQNIVEGILRRDDLFKATEVYLINSVRRKIPAVIVDPPVEGYA